MGKSCTDMYIPRISGYCGKQFTLRRDIVYYESSDFWKLRTAIRYFDTDRERWQYEV